MPTLLKSSWSMANTLSTNTPRKENWLSVYQYLQQLPWPEKDRGYSTREEQELEKGLALALEVFREGDFQQRWQVGKILPKLGKRAIAPLLEILEDEEEDIELRWFVCGMLADFEDRAVILALVKLLGETEEEELSAMAGSALAKIGTKAIGDITSLLSGEDHSRLLAVQALSYIRRLEVIEPLLGMVGDPLAEIRAIAIETLSSFRDQPILPILITALEDQAARVRKEAVVALGLRSKTVSELDLVSLLKPLLWDLNLEVCQQTAIALGRIGSNAAADALFALLQSPMAEVDLQLVVVRSLSWVGTERVLEYFRSALTLVSESVSQEIVRVLGQQSQLAGQIKATRILMDFLKVKGDSEELKKAIAMSLGELGQEEAISSLEELAKDEEKSVKLHAIAALKKI